MKTIAFIIAFLVAQTVMAQKKNTFLAIYDSKDKIGVTMYPPGTKYTLTDSTGSIIFDETSFEGSFEIKNAYILTVYPSWKEDSDEYELTDGIIEVLPAPVYKPGKHKKNFASEYNGVSVNKTLFDSSENPDRKNVVLEFTNGIRFTYTDGKARAELNGQELEIIGKYIIRSKIGETRLSFNPKTGIVWWVFDPSAKH